MARKKKSWSGKLEDAKAKEDLPKKFYCDKAKQHMLVPSPAQIEQEIRRIRKSKIKTIKQVTDKLAAEHGVDVCCPMTTGNSIPSTPAAGRFRRSSSRKKGTPS